MTRLGVICGFQAEAACLRAQDIAVVCSGGSTRRALAEAKHLVARGAAGLVSFGLAGGLDPSLRAGDLILADAVLAADGRRLATDALWTSRLAELAQAAGLIPRRGVILGGDRLVPTPEAKRALFRMTRTLAVDMESHAVATAASEAGLPYLVVRAIADGAKQTIPPAARAALTSDGRIRTLVVLGRLLRSPSQTAELIRLGMASRRGLASLRRVAALGPPCLAIR